MNASHFDAARLAPGGPVMGPIIGKITELHGPGPATAVADGAARAEAWLAARPVRVTFGGYFSSGKSTLINMLIGLPLLPADYLPETGVPCLLQSGDANQVLVQIGEGTREIPFTTEAISGYVTMTGDDGTLREEIREVRDVRITLANDAVPADATWVDSPGISDGMNDDRKRAELPAKLARDGDLLVWVVNSAQELSTTEQDFLAAYIKESGPAGVVFVVNAFLTDDTPERWQAFTARRGYAGRIEQNIDTGDVPLRIVLASARAAAADCDGFGGPETRALLVAHSTVKSPRVLATRTFRAVAELGPVAATLDQLVAVEERRYAEAVAEAAATQATWEKERRDFRYAVRREIESVLNANSDLGGDAAREVMPESGETPSSPEYYGSRFESELKNLVGRLADDLEQAIDQCAYDHGHGGLDYSGKQEIIELLELGDASISGGGGGGGGGGSAGSAAGGAVIGAMVGGPVGMVIGGLLGAVLGGSSSTSKQCDAIRSGLRNAGRRANARILGARNDVTDIAEEHCWHSDPESAPSDGDLEAMRRLRERFKTDVVGPLSASLTVALNAVDG
jgi:Dynamin family